MSDIRCNIAIWKGLNNRIKYIEGMDLEEALSMEQDYRKNALLFTARHGCTENVMYCVKEHDEELDIITTIHFFKDTFISMDEVREYTRKMPHAEFGILYSDRIKHLADKALAEEKSKRIAPITLKEANAFVTANHRHHDSVTGCKFAVGLYKTVSDKDQLIGTAICGRPVSRHLDDGFTLEINRLCTTEEGNCCSMLYGACSRIAKEMGYRKVITYILESEPGISLKASNFVLEDEHCGGGNWTGKRKRQNNVTPEEYKQRWVKYLAA